MEPPLCWITNEFDRSPGELLWVESPDWGALRGSLLNLSYGMGQAFLVPHQRIGELTQGGMIALPIPNFPTGVMRGRFHPQDGQLYVCGMFAWAGNAQEPGGLYRIRATGRPIHLPGKLRAVADGLELEFTAPLSSQSVEPENFMIKTWSLKRTANYGSNHFNETVLQVESAQLQSDGLTVKLKVPAIEPTWCMEIKYQLTTQEGQSLSGKIHNTIHVLPK
jgi:hypothetical protein